MSWTPDEIKALLNRSQHAVERGLVAIYLGQTEGERVAEETLEHNAVGFSAFHAKTGSYLAGWVRSGRHLSGRWVEKGRNLILHYARQLADIANENEARKAAN